MRTGVIAKKVGMTRLFQADGQHVPVTLLALEDCQVVSHRTAERDGYYAVQLGAGEAKQKNVAKPQREHFAKANVGLKMKVAEFRVADESGLVPIGSTISAEHFILGQKVDVTGPTQGKGFAGPIKRWGFGGMRATHGVSISHRAHGSTGNRQDPGRVFKGKKMAGHMGDRQRTQQNLEIVRTDAERGLLFVKGAVPGAKNSWLLVRDAVKLPVPKEAPFPGAVLEKRLAHNDDIYGVAYEEPTSLAIESNFVNAHGLVPEPLGSVGLSETAYTEQVSKLVTELNELRVASAQALSNRDAELLAQQLISSADKLRAAFEDRTMPRAYEAKAVAARLQIEARALLKQCATQLFSDDARVASYAARLVARHSPSTNGRLGDIPLEGKLDERQSRDVAEAVSQTLADAGNRCYIWVTNLSIAEGSRPDLRKVSGRITLTKVIRTFDDEPRIVLPDNGDKERTAEAVATKAVTLDIFGASDDVQFHPAEDQSDDAILLDAQFVSEISKEAVEDGKLRMLLVIPGVLVQQLYPTVPADSLIAQ